MRPVPWLLAEPYRIARPGLGLSSNYGDGFGVFVVRHKGLELRVIATNGDHVAAELPPEYAWEHVSVSLPNRTPNWYEMNFIKDLFWLETETVVQFHVPKSEHINLHPHCLHLWRPVNGEIPRPPADTVA